MKIRNTFITFAALVFSSSVSAIPIATTGGADTMVDWGNPGNSDADETAFFADYLGVDSSLVDYAKIDIGGSGWVGVDENSDLWSFDFGDMLVDYFMVKMGSGVGLAGDGSDETYSHYLYGNDNRYGVIDLTTFDRSKGSLEIYMLSHSSVALGEGTTVPEPSVLALLGLGLFGLGIARKSKK